MPIVRTQDIKKAVPKILFQVSKGDKEKVFYHVWLISLFYMLYG
jgi:hypothetical protein